jgi:hypothetical protein
MSHAWKAAALLLALAPAARAADEPRPQPGGPPEQLLPAGTQIYLRWDGLAAHRASYEKTALGQMMKGDTGNFLASVIDQVQEGLGTLLTVEQLLGGVPPEKLQKLQADAAEAAKLPGVLTERGFVFALEVRALDPPAGQVTLIVPDAGAGSASLAGAVRLGAGLAKAEVKALKVGGRAVEAVQAGPVSLAWWNEGPHAVVTLGTDPPEAAVKALTAGGDRLPSNPLFRRVRDFKGFETGARAFVDVAAFVKLAGGRGPEVQKLLDELGLTGVRSLVAYTGFDGEAERGLAEWDIPGPRKGLLTLLEGKPFRLEDVPPLPPDVVSWSVTNFDAGAFYDTAYRAAQQVAGLVDPDQVAAVKAFPLAANTALGVDLRKDLMASLGDKVVFYSSPSEGPLTLGQTVLFKVKDPERLLDTLDQVAKALGKLSATEVAVRKKKIHGAELHEVIVRQQGFIFVPSYAVHNGWLAVGFFPQAVKGFVQRSAGELPCWKPSERVRQSLKDLPQQFVSISYSDPRPSIRQLLSLAPLIGGAVRSFNPDLKFEVGSIPNAQAATERLFPNLSVTTDDGKTLRLETRSSLTLPFELSGIDTYGLFLFFGFARIAAF